MKPNWFIGAPVDPGAWYEALPAPPGGAWKFHRADLHVTVAFLGGCTEAEAHAAWAAVDDWHGSELVAALGPVQPFGRSALSATLADGHAAVAALIEALRDPARAAAGLGPEARPPTPHLTIARTHRRAGKHERQAARAWAAGLPMDGTLISLSELALYTWSEDRQTRQFRAVARRPLVSLTEG